MADLEVGILIIGSLIWDPKPHRECWRRERLQREKAIRVLAPIRYGRISQGRANTYTMVFSNALLPDKLGRAIAVPCAEKVSTPDELVTEAQALWAAEQSTAAVPGPIAASWGAVGLLLNPNRASLDDIRAGWTQRVTSERKWYSGFRHAANEQPAVGDDGFLTVLWPTTESGIALELDALLATATQPSLSGGTYATSEVIAAAWRRAPEHRDYLDENRRVGITTSDDENILRYLAAQPANNGLQPSARDGMMARRG